jgi:meiotically up-regulated gene 157 (Mug157) protein
MRVLPVADFNRGVAFYRDVLGFEIRPEKQEGAGMGGAGFDGNAARGVAERKREVDSLCYCIRLAHGYCKATGDTSPFDQEWTAAMRLIVATFCEQQKKSGPGRIISNGRRKCPQMRRRWADMEIRRGPWG